MNVNGIDATYYAVKDLEKCTAFYRTLLGGEPTATAPDTFSEWTFADDSSFGLYHTPSPDVKPSGSAMFAVDDVAAAVAQAKASGVAFHGDGNVMDTPACHMAFGMDPEGNEFILHKRK